MTKSLLSEDNGLFTYHAISGALSGRDSVQGVWAYLSKQDYENWRYGRVDYFERVCKANLSKLPLVMREMRSYAAKTGLKLSFCYSSGGGPRRKTDRSAKLAGQPETSPEEGGASNS